MNQFVLIAVLAVLAGCQGKGSDCSLIANGTTYYGSLVLARQNLSGSCPGLPPYTISTIDGGLPSDAREATFSSFNEDCENYDLPCRCSLVEVVSYTIPVATISCDVTLYTNTSGSGLCELTADSPDGGLTAEGCYYTTDIFSTTT